MKNRNRLMSLLMVIGGNVPLTTSLLLGNQLDNMKAGIELLDLMDVKKDFVFAPG